MSVEEPGGAPAPRRHPHFDLSDGLRGIASSAVVLVHVALFTIPLADGSLLDRGIIRLDIAFTVFFALSSFLLYRPMIAHRTGGARAPKIKGYAVRRFLRVYPAYWIALTCLAIFPGLLGVFTNEWLGFYSLLGNLETHYGAPECAGEIFRCGLPQTWSLTAEITFYAVLPAYVLLTNRMARGRKRRTWVRNELVLLALLAIASAVFSIGPFDLRDDYWFRFSMLGNMLWIAVGLALAVISVALQGSRRPQPLSWLAANPTACWGLAGILWALLVLALPAQPYIVPGDTDLEFLASYVSFAAVSLLIMIPIVFPNARGLPRRLLAWRPVAWLGVVAFGTFLWHVTISYNLGSGAIGAGFWVTLILTFAITIPIAAASYYLVEKPLMAPRRRGRYERRQ